MMLKLQMRVMIKDACQPFVGKIGTIVAMNTPAAQKCPDQRKILCKVRVGDELSDWIPNHNLKIMES